MMYWGNGMGGWGMAFFAFSNLLFWGLLAVGVVALVRYSGRTAPQHHGPSGDVSGPQRILAERFARGEIDEDEYNRRLRVLHGGPPA